MSHDGGARWERIGANGTFADDLVDPVIPISCLSARARPRYIAREKCPCAALHPLDGKLYRFESLVPALDLALGHWMMGRTAQLFDLPVGEPLSPADPLSIPGALPENSDKDI